MTNVQASENGSQNVRGEMDSGSEFEGGSASLFAADFEAAGAFDESTEVAILVVEDEKVVLKATSEVLQSSGYRLFCASDGAKALALCSELSRLDLLLVDLVMPGIDGGELARQVKLRFPQIRVLLMTGYHEQYEVEESSGNAEGCLRKPFSAGTLLIEVRKILESYAR